MLRWIALGVMSGLGAGVVSFVFLEGLDLVTATRVDNPWLLWLLPVVGLILGLVNLRLGGRAVGGNRLVFAEIASPTAYLPRRMTPLVLVGTWVTHLFGGSAGREGTALQMSSSLSDTFARFLGLGPDERSRLLVVALAAGFGSVFGVPLAGVVFALEVDPRGTTGLRSRLDVSLPVVVPAICAAFVGDRLVRLLGHAHAVRPRIEVSWSPALGARIALAGFVFGLAAWSFKRSTSLVATTLSRRVPWSPLRPMIGGVAVVGLAVLFGRDHLGLSLPLIDAALDGERLGFAVFALKIVFTAVTIGSGFPGGEVTPLFVVGATLGAALAAPLGVPVVLLAAVGLVAVFAGAARAPLACSVMAAELFGFGAFTPALLACGAAVVTAGRRGLYSVQAPAAAGGGPPVGLTRRR